MFSEITTLQTLEGVFILILHFICSAFNLPTLRNPHLSEQQSAAQWLLGLLHSISLRVTSVPKRLIQGILQPSLASLLMLVQDLKMAVRQHCSEHHSHPCPDATQPPPCITRARPFCRPGQQRCRQRWHTQGALHQSPLTVGGFINIFNLRGNINLIEMLLTFLYHSILYLVDSLF